TLGDSGAFRGRELAGSHVGAERRAHADAPAPPPPPPAPPPHAPGTGDTAVFDHVLRPRLRPRCRVVAVRRLRPSARWADGAADPRQVLQGHDPRYDVE